MIVRKQLRCLDQRDEAADVIHHRTSRCRRLTRGDRFNDRCMLRNVAFRHVRQCLHHLDAQITHLTNQEADGFLQNAISVTPEQSRDERPYLIGNRLSDARRPWRPGSLRSRIAIRSDLLARSAAR